MWHGICKNEPKLLNQENNLFKEVLERDDVQLFGIEYFNMKIVLNVEDGSFTIIKQNVPIKINTNLDVGKIIFKETKSIDFTLDTLDVSSPKIQSVTIGFEYKYGLKMLKLNKNGIIEI